MPEGHQFSQPANCAFLNANHGRCGAEEAELRVYRRREVSPERDSKTRPLLQSTTRVPLTLSPAVGGRVALADLVGQPLEVLGQVGVLFSVGDDLDALVQHVVAQLLELAHVLPPHQHEVLQVRLVLDRLQEQRLEGGVVDRAPAAEEHKRFGLVQLLDLALLNAAVM